MKHVPSSDDQGSQAHLLSSLQIDYEKLSHLQQEANEAYQRVQKEEDITSSQCTRIILPLLPPDHPVIHLKNLLEHPLHFPSIDTQRQQLLIALDQIDTCIQQLRQEATLFSQMSFKPPIDEMRKIRENILGTLQNIEQKLSHFNSLLRSILEITILQEERNSPNSPDQSSTPHDEQCLPSIHPDFSSQSPIIEEANASDFTPSHQDHAFLPTASRIINVLINKFSVMLERSHTKTQSSPPGSTTDFSLSPVISTETPEQHLQRLYKKAQFTSQLEIQEICLNLGIDFDSLTDTSPAGRVMSLTQQMYKKNRLDDLERELRHIVPGRFSPDEPMK